MKNPRYDGKPLLRLVECYVLLAIDKLPKNDVELLTKMEPQLAGIYGETGSWDKIIASTLEFPDTMPDSIRRMWKRNQEIAETHGVTLEPQEFAEMFVDQNIEI